MSRKCRLFVPAKVRERKLEHPPQLCGVGGAERTRLLRIERRTNQAVNGRRRRGRAHSTHAYRTTDQSSSERTASEGPSAHDASMTHTASSPSAAHAYRGHAA